MSGVKKQLNLRKENREVFDWSPLPARKKLGEVPKIDNQSKDLYPNCDVNVWLRSCDEEVTEPILGKVTGEIPKWLEGSLYRNGPGSIKVGSEEFGHLFDGSAHIHRFIINSGNVKYQCRFLRSDVYKRNVEANCIVATEFGTKSVADPCNSIFKRVTSLFKPEKMMSDNAMISIYPFGKDLYAFGESPVIHRIDTDNLDSLGKVNVYERIGLISQSSHPHIESDGSVYNLGMVVGTSGPVHNIVRYPIGSSSEEMFDNAKVVASLPARWMLHPSYMHTFGITENYFVIVEQPLSLSLPSMVKCTLKNDPLVGSFSWYGEEMTQINLICRKTGRCVRKFFAESFFYLHIINQYEDAEDETVVLDVCGYRDPAMIDCMYIDAMRNMQKNPDYAKMFRGRPLRFILPMLMTDEKVGKAGAEISDDGEICVKPLKLCDLGCETPRINYERHLGRKYRYFYAISSDVDADNPGTIIKVDTCMRNCKTWCEPNCYPSEPIFIANPDCKDEDDGIVVSSMIWGGEDTNTVGILILDAKTFSEITRAVFTTPSAVPKCLHGWFQPLQTHKQIIT
ncbi:PREDICTED: carotenoid isomerooxygenase [Nicrophorus vespilloides]|uniref:Carotenoid isomerooxygenase n=1 Tax=Nicrophorus vespilloides TaxID=110193 RepID=A0ABM1NEL5_NICVS|nr:PREDICTED: carotenoid isomerooxygenase [Nicrophorus vespilloides]